MVKAETLALGKIRFVSLGCKVNQYETAAVQELFRARGFEHASEDEPADVVVVNTCAVTAESERKSGQLIRRMKAANPRAVLAVMGCFSQRDPETVRKACHADVVSGTKNRTGFVDDVVACVRARRSRNDETCERGVTVCGQAQGQGHEREREKAQEQEHGRENEHGSGAGQKQAHEQEHGHEDQHGSGVGQKWQKEDFEEFGVIPGMERTRAFVKIQDGCNRFCSYCIIPYLRGPIRSREQEKVLREIEQLVANGYSEVVLTGIHVSSYGVDWEGASELGELVTKVAAISGLRRLRLSSLEPTIITEQFTAHLKSCEDVFCPHFHLSLQSGSETVLKRMNRRYSPDQYLQAVNRLRCAFSEAAFTTDIIVGFPGETDMEFEESLSFCREIGFSKIHVFKFSPRSGTPAARYPNQIDGRVKADRSKRMLALSEEMALAFHQSYVGRIVSVLIERETDKSGELVSREDPVHRADPEIIGDQATGHLGGMTANYIRVTLKASHACCTEGTECTEGSIRTVRITGADAQGCTGIEV